MTWQQWYIAVLLILSVAYAPVTAMKKFDTSVGVTIFLAVFWALCALEWYALASGGFW